MEIKIYCILHLENKSTTEVKDEWNYYFTFPIRLHGLNKDKYYSRIQCQLGLSQAKTNSPGDKLGQVSTMLKFRSTYIAVLFKILYNDLLLEQRIVLRSCRW